ncbi:MAG: hypothetical protein ACYDHZ_04685 [Dehalococcoidia bacterium]
MAKFTLSEKQYNEVLRLANMYYREARKCMDGKAYLAGCVMMGAALEAALLAFADCYSYEARRSKSAPTRKRVIKPLTDWQLRDLLAVAKDRDWLPSSLSADQEWNGKKAQIGDWAVMLQQIRNLVHPSRYMLDVPRKRITKPYLETAFKIFEVATDHLLNKIYKHLRIVLEKADEDGNTPENLQPTK